MGSTTFAVRVDAAAKTAGEIEYLDVNEWQVAGIKQAIASLDRGEGIAHEQVREWVMSWGDGKERPIPRRS
jgi:RHH-type rel operon transcriptional repressor/antitoxin RelB